MNVMPLSSYWLVLRPVLRHEISMVRKPLICAEWNRYENVVKYLLKYGAEVSAKDVASGRTALSFTVARGNKDVVKLILARGVDLEMPDSEYKWAPLRWAVRNGSLGHKAANRSRAYYTGP